MHCVSYDICVYHVWFVCVFFPGVFLHYRVSGACPVTTDLIMRLIVRTVETTSVVTNYETEIHIIANTARRFSHAMPTIIRLRTATDTGHPLGGLSNTQVPRWSLSCI